MPRRESPRSPLGSTTSKRSHRDADQHERSRKDDGRSYRRRSRTRSPENRYRDREYRHHRDRSRDRYREHDGYRSTRRERSPRERRRSRDRDGLNDYRKRSRDRDANIRRDDSRDRARKRKEDESRELPHKPNMNGTRAEPTLTAEQKQAERQKKLEEWKRKQAAERERKQQEAQAAGGTRGLLAEIDRKSQLSAAVASPVSPQAATDPSEATAPAPYAGPFDPKAIAKKVAASNSSSTKLGALPEITKVSAPSDPKQARLKANLPSAPNGTTGKAPVAPRAFGLSAKATIETEKAKPGLDFGDDEGGRKKLEKLADIADDGDVPVGNADESDGDNDDGDVDDNDDETMQDTEEMKEARRQRLEDKREERLQAQEESTVVVSTANDSNVDVAMAEPPGGVETDSVEEESDPLDAFMAGIADAPPKKSSKTTKQVKGEALFSDDEVELEAVEDDLATATTIKKGKKKDIPASVSGRNSTTSFRKNFYKVPSELDSLSEADITDIRHELGIKVKGTLPIPTPVQSFSSLGLNPATYDCIQILGYEKPTGIQSQAIPAIMSGRDVLGIASTGSGKTLAFLLPLFRHILDQRPLAGQDGPIALIMTPTRELASQITKEGRPFFKAQNLTAVTAVGGNPIKDDIAAIKRGCHLVVGTPGRLLELLSTSRLRLQRITYMVLDEADRMFDMGFEPQVTRIESFIRRDSQKVFTSATLNRQMAALAGKLLNSPLEITVGGKSVVNSDVDQRVEVLQSSEAKFTRLLELLGNLYERDENADVRVLIFVERQETCDTLMVSLLRKGYPCSTLHGGKDQVDRDSTISDFKAGVIPVLIATSVAARGLDVKELRLVISYDAPSHLEDYVHRCGRTGRAGQKGAAYTFLTPEQDRFSIGIAKALRESGVSVPEPVKRLVESFDEKVKSGKEKISGSGFGGKGLERLDQERDAARARERKTHKTGDEMDEDETEEKEKEDKGDDLITKAASSVQPASAPTPLPGVPKGIDLDGKIIVHKTEAPTADAKNALDKVSQAITSINERLSKNKELRQGVPIDNKGPDAGAFHATLEINDFPQKARWAVTNRTNVAKVLEATGTSITTKGSFYATGKEPQAGENPKLYILVEGDTEVVVTNAMRELMRLLKEGTISAADSDARAPTSGRYNVV